MANFKEPQHRASETATFRFTREDKLLLSDLSRIEGCSRTELLRRLLRERAMRSDSPAWEGSAPEWSAGSEPSPQMVSPPPEESTAVLPDEPVIISTFGQLLCEFQAHSGVRGARVQQELDDTVRFVTGADGDGALLSKELSLQSINGTMLQDVREKIRVRKLRFPAKNLHLTYLRMIFNFAVNRGLLTGVDPAEDLRSLTAREVADALPLSIRTT